MVTFELNGIFVETQETEVNSVELKINGVIYYVYEKDFAKRDLTSWVTFAVKTR